MKISSFVSQLLQVVGVFSMFCLGSISTQRKRNATTRKSKKK